MTAKRMSRFAIPTVLALAALWHTACASGSGGVTAPSVVVRSETGERATANVVQGFVSAVGGAYNRATGSQGPAQAGSGILGEQWRAPFNAASSSCDGVALRYFTASGQEQPAYDSATTSRVTAKGPCSTPQGIVTLDATADDAQASSPTLLVNGTAEGTYEGNAVRVVVTNVRMTKQFCGAPASGVIVATMDSLTATVRFDGSLTVQGTYTWSGIGVSFSFALPGCS